MILMLGALSFAFLQNGLAEKTMVEQRGSMLHALEIAEKGVVQACVEIRFRGDGDGLGTVHGDDDIYGAFVAKTITIAGNSRFHYDRALGESDHYGEALLERLYWRDLDERIR